MHVHGKGSCGRVIRQPTLLSAHFGQGQPGATEFRGQRQQQILRRAEFLEIFLNSPGCK